MYLFPPQKKIKNSAHYYLSSFSGSTKKLKSQRAAAPAQSPIEAHEDEEVRLIKAPNFIPRQAEMRQEKSVGVTPSHAVVARLMGLELNHNKVALTPVPEVEYNARMKLLGAVEKCDEDLKALQRIIQVVKPAGGNKSFDAALPLPLRTYFVIFFFSNFVDIIDPFLSFRLINFKHYSLRLTACLNIIIFFNDYDSMAYILYKKIISFMMK